MRYRKLDPVGDYSFGKGLLGDFLIDTPEAVAQAIITRLRLVKGEWFLDTQDGTPWFTEILGKPLRAVRDTAIRTRILGTTGVSEILSYRTFEDANQRKYTAQVVVRTVYGVQALALYGRTEDGADYIEARLAS